MTPNQQCMRNSFHLRVLGYAWAMFLKTIEEDGDAGGQLPTTSNDHGKSLLTPNRNPTYNMHFFFDILVLTIGYILKYGFGVKCWGYDPISMKRRCLTVFHHLPARLRRLHALHHRGADGQRASDGVSRKKPW